MKKNKYITIFFTICMILCATACGKQTALDPKDDHSGDIPLVIEDKPDHSIGGGDDIYRDGGEADIDTDGCFIVFLVGSREMTAWDLRDDNSSLYTYDLDDLELGEWLHTNTFDMCHYKWYQYGTTSPENWYAIKPTATDFEITFDADIYSITYDGKEYKKEDYGTYDYTYGGYFVITPEGVEYRRETVEETFDITKGGEFCDLCFDDYAIVVVKEITPEPFNETFDIIDEKANTEFHSEDLDCFLLGQWWYTKTFEVCRYGYDIIDDTVYSYYAIALNKDADITIYSLGAEKIYFYGEANLTTVYEIDPCAVEGDDDFWASRNGWFTLSAFDGVGYQEYPILFNDTTENGKNEEY